MTQSVGFLLSNLGSNQLAYSFIEGVNSYYADGGGVDIVAFIQNVTRPIIRPHFAIMNTVEAFGFTGPMVATDLYTMDCLLRFPGPSRKLGYLWDLEWMRSGTRSWEESHRTYASLPLIARSEGHRKVIEAAWNVEVQHVVEDANILKLLEISLG